MKTYVDRIDEVKAYLIKEDNISLKDFQKLNKVDYYTELNERASKILRELNY
jgi:hypothetical protein